MSCRSTPSLLPRIARLMVVAAICLSLGMHWALLQGIAWTGMLISFARDGAVIEAVQKTFDGQHGCALCAKVKEGRDSDRNQPQQSGESVKKLDAVLVEITRLIPPAAEMISCVITREALLQRNQLPETPPPRRGLA
ncbi:MAG: hypothetical protein R3F13_08315 [Prosthecobacter sp.]